MRYEIIIFSGTTEGRLISDALEEAGISHLVCVATQVGENVMTHGCHTKIQVGRLDQDAMVELFRKNHAKFVIDATHPYAVEATNNIQAASKEAGVSYKRVLRASDEEALCDDRICYFDSAKDCARELESTTGNILLTTGSKELHIFCEKESVRERIYARVLPAEESLNLCKEAGLDQRRIIAMFGPFSKEMNVAIMHQCNASILVTKESGSTGGFAEKVSAALECGYKVYVIGRPAEEEGQSVSDIISDLTKTEMKSEGKAIEILLIGIGPGNSSWMNQESLHQLYDADIIIGANRMLEMARDILPADVQKKIEWYTFYLAKDIIPVAEAAVGETSVATSSTKRIVILFSGDTGVYSGATELYKKLAEWRDQKSGLIRNKISIKLYPGVSSISYFASVIGESYTDSAIESWHGKGHDEAYPGMLAETVRRNAKTFLLLSDGTDVRRLGDLLNGFGLEHCQIVLGTDLSYQTEQIYQMTVEECCQSTFGKGLFVALICNSKPRANQICALPDEMFCREKIPMTKADVRHLCISKLGLCEGAVLFDIGAGSGSVSIEAAKQYESIRVYAIERKSEAIDLIQKNLSLLKCPNVTTIHALAPEGLEELPIPTHAFIGGSAGNLKEIVHKLYELNPNIRIVMTAVTIETVSEMTEVLKYYGASDSNAELIQVSISKNRQAGDYTLMMAQNPVYIGSL